MEKHGKGAAWRGVLASLWLAVGVGLFAPAGMAEGAEGAWRALGEDDGVRVWELTVPGKDMPGFRGETSIAAPIERVIAVLDDVEKHTEWMHRCAQSEVLRRFDREHLILYNRTHTPWPVWDRDVVLETRIERSADGRTVTLAFHDTDPTLRTLPRRVVRMPKLEGFYKLEAVSPERTRVTYQVEVDIGGSVPHWAAERVARDMPHHTLERLRERVEALHARR